MEDVLTVYKRPYSPDMPVVCVDETSKQLIKETRLAISAKIGKLYRYDYQYERNGVCSLFMFYEAFGGKRFVSVTDRRTKIDWATQVKELLDIHYPNAKKVILIMDNLNTHTEVLHCMRHLNRRKPDVYLIGLKYIIPQNTSKSTKIPESRVTKIPDPKIKKLFNITSFIFNIFSPVAGPFDINDCRIMNNPVNYC